MVKKWIYYASSVIISLIITFVLFESMSWYHFGDYPTKVVLAGLIVCFCLLAVLLISIITLIIKKRKNNKIS